jgi:hypothetical protein
MSTIEEVRGAMYTAGYDAKEQSLLEQWFRLYPIALLDKRLLARLDNVLLGLIVCGGKPVLDYLEGSPVDKTLFVGVLVELGHWDGVLAALKVIHKKVIEADRMAASFKKAGKNG